MIHKLPVRARFLSRCFKVDRQRLVEDLRGIRVIVVHPEGAERNLRVKQLKRFGGRVQVAWPCPASPSKYVGLSQVCCSIRVLST